MSLQRCLHRAQVPHQRFPSGSVVTNLPANARDTGDLSLIPGLGRSPWSRKWQSAPIFLPGEFHRPRSLLGYHWWGRRESDMTEQLSTHIHKSQVKKAHSGNTHKAMWLPSLGRA